MSDLTNIAIWAIAIALGSIFGILKSINSTLKDVASAIRADAEKLAADQYNRELGKLENKAAAVIKQKAEGESTGYNNADKMKSLLEKLSKE